MRRKVLAVAAALLLSECLLRAWVFLADSWRRGHGAAASTVWCVGDSNTRGDGAAEGQSYPEHLGRALGEPVLNLGQSGANSAQAVGRLERQLGLRKPPAVVLFLAGGNDGWNLREVEPSLLADSRLARIRRSLQGLRLLQVARAVMLRLLPARGSGLGPGSDALALTAAAVNAGDFPKALEHFDRFRSLKPGPGVRFGTSLDADLVLQELRRLALMSRGEADPSLYAAPPAPGWDRDEAFLFRLGRGWWRLGRGDPAAAAEDFEGLLKFPLSPLQRAEALQGAGWCLLRQGRPGPALARFDAVLKEGAAVPVRQARFFWAHAGSVLAASASGDRVRARRELERLPVPLPLAAAEARAAGLLQGGGKEREVLGITPVTSYLEYRDHLLFHPALDAEFRQRELAFYLSRLRSLARRHGFRAVVLTYPQQSAFEVNERLRDLSGELGLPLVELEGALVDAAGRRFVSGDGYHPDGEGYRRMSERIRGGAFREP